MKQYVRNAGRDGFEKVARRCEHLSSVETSSACVCGVSEHGVLGLGLSGNNTLVVGGRLLS